MLQSCETLITKINEWQKAILELEELSEKFLNSGDEKLKSEIENKKREIISLEKEYQILGYPELPNGQNLFWPEKELLEWFMGEIETELIEAINKNKIEIKDGHLEVVNLRKENLFEFSSLDFSLFNKLEWFDAWNCDLRIFPKLPESIKRIDVERNRGILIPEDLTYLKNLEEFRGSYCGLRKLPRLTGLIKKIVISDYVAVPDEEKQRIKIEYPNAVINF